MRTLPNLNEMGEKITQANQKMRDQNLESNRVRKLAERAEKDFVPKFVEKMRQSWAEYNLHSKDMYFTTAEGSRVPTEYQGIFYRGKFIAFRHKNYHVYPHEQVFQTCDPVLKELGLVMKNPPKEQSGFSMAYGKEQFAKVESNFKNVTDEKSGKRVRVQIAGQIRATYVFDGRDEKFDVTGDGKNVVQFGVELENGIDGHMALRMSPYSFRQVCENGMMHKASVMEISESIMQNLRNENKDVFSSEKIMQQVGEIMQGAKTFDEIAHKIKNERMTHLQSYPTNWIRARLYLINEQKDLFKQRYREMTELITSQRQAELLVKTMPKRMIDELDWLEVKEREVDETINGQVVSKTVKDVIIPKPTTQWDAFNSITFDLTHKARAFQSRSTHYGNLDKILVRATQ